VTTPSVVSRKCSNRSCPGLEAAEHLVPCQNSACSREFHLSYFHERFKKETWPKLQDGQIVCTKACYNKLANPPRFNWTNDGKNGPDDPQSSERILLDWLLFLVIMLTNGEERIIRVRTKSKLPWKLPN